MRCCGCTDLSSPVSLVKSEREMIYIRKAAEQATAGLGGAREVIRPGIPEIELAGEIESAMRDAGSEF